MKIYQFSQMIVRTFMGLGGSKVVKLHQATNGWVVIVRDETDGQEYIGTFYPVTSAKDVAPNTFNEFMAMTKDVNNG